MSQSRRGSTQIPEAGPSTSRRASRVVDTGDSDEENQPRVSKASSSKRKVAKIDEDADAGNGSDNDDEFGELAQPLSIPQIDEEFRNQPLKRDEAAIKLNNLIKEWKEVERKVQGSLELLANSAGDLQEALANGDDDEEATEELNLADRDFRRILDKMFEVKLRRQSLEQLRARLADGVAVPNALDAMEEAVDKELTRYKSQTSRKKYLTSEAYSDFRSLLWESMGNGQGVPNVKTFLHREEGDSESDDEDIEVGAVAQNYKDPITFTWLEKPVKSNSCKHVFSRASITAHIRQSPARTSGPCPVAGCNKIVILSELQDDPQLERRVQQQKRREQEQEERVQSGYQAIDDDEDSDEVDINVRRPKKREE